VRSAAVLVAAFAVRRKFPAHLLKRYALQYHPAGACHRGEEKTFATENRRFYAARMYENQTGTGKPQQNETLAAEEARAGFL
jgi:hypothetical protein